MQISTMGSKTLRVHYEYLYCIDFISRTKISKISWGLFVCPGNQWIGCRKPKSQKAPNSDA